MPYIGSDPSNRFVAPKAASVFSGDGSTTAFTLDHAVGSDEDILVSVDGVIQEPSVAYAVSNGTTLTFTAAPSSNSGNNIFVYYLFRTVGTVSHPSNNALTATSGTFSTTLGVTGQTVLGAASAPSLWSSSNNFIISDTSSDGGMAILSGTSGNGNIMFSDTTAGAFSDARGLITYLHASDDMRFMTANTEHMRISSIGAVTKPSQPAFNVHKNNSAQQNIAINLDVIVTFGAEFFDVNSDFDTSNSTFTAPVTGKYFFTTALRFAQLDTDANFHVISILTSNRQYRTIVDPNDTFQGDPDFYSMTTTTLADMDAGDTARVEFNQGAGSAIADISGDTQFSYFAGCLIC